MKNNKIFILLPDGVGLRNFAFTNFYNLGKEFGFDITYWNNTPFDLTKIGFNEIKICKQNHHIVTEILKNAKTQIELNLFISRFNDITYNNYRFPFSNKSLKQRLKTFATKCIIKHYSSEFKVIKLNEQIIRFEEKTTYFKDCLQLLKTENPAFVFCTNQRSMASIAPIQAAKNLGIPTGTFIFSWDNLPKATLIIETDYYFVWSEFMKSELQKYYPQIKDEQIKITGTPQFENHFNNDIKIDRINYFKMYNLDISKKYICFSGDDITTSPNDPQYLKDTAKAIKNLNKKGYNLGIIFRRCPADFSNRFDKVLRDYSDIIISIKPLWKQIGEGWDTILPTKEDMVLQTNTIAHTEFVVNLGSSMVFDYASYNKPCVYINYDVTTNTVSKWSVNKIYKFIHFRSMPSQNAVVWLNSPNEIESKIEILVSKNKDIKEAQKWFETINLHPVDKASERIWESIKTIIK